MLCPACGSEVMVFYTDPLQFKCVGCNVELIDRNAEPFPVRLTDAEGRKRRPGIYGDPACPRCGHAVHGGSCDVSCEFCVFVAKPHVYDLCLKSLVG